MTAGFVLRELSRYSFQTFADIIYRNALLYPDQEAFVCGGERVTFGCFNERVNRLIHGLEGLGIKKGHVIGILSWNRLEYPEVFGAAMKAGFVLAHFNPRLQPEELIHVINDSQAAVVVLSPEFIGVAETIRKRLPSTQAFLVFGATPESMTSCGELVRNQSTQEPEPVVEKNDPLVIFYTSGTTGTPRGAVYTHDQKMTNTCMKALDIGVQFGDRHLVVLPMFHIGGDSHIWPFFLVGGCNVIMPRPAFDPLATLRIMVRERITDVHIVPTQLIALLNLPDVAEHDLGQLKRIWYAASPMPTDVLKRGLKIFGPIFIQGYGLTESGPHSTVLIQANHRQASGSVAESNVLASCGQPCIGVHVRIIDEVGNDVPPGEIGEIIVRSERVMSGYWRNVAATENTVRKGWLHTGDLGYYDEKGFIYVADRKKDMIVTGGENVYPKEVEEILYRHPAVLEAAVIGIPDDYWIERVHALVVLKAGAQATAEEIIGFCRQQISHYKCPKGVDFIDSLPKNPQGKILKKEIRKLYCSKESSAPVAGTQED